MDMNFVSITFEPSNTYGWHDVLWDRYLSAVN